ncbi:MAG: hypothetical protein ACRECY_01125 [Phyllobacterium sp.]
MAMLVTMLAGLPAHADNARPLSPDLKKLRKDLSTEYSRQMREGGFYSFLTTKNGDDATFRIFDCRQANCLVDLQESPPFQGHLFLVHMDGHGNMENMIPVETYGALTDKAAFFTDDKTGAVLFVESTTHMGEISQQVFAIHGSDKGEQLAFSASKGGKKLEDKGDMELLRRAINTTAKHPAPTEF